MSSLSCSIGGGEWDNNFTPRRWAELKEAVASTPSRTQDMSKLELIGEPLLADDESSEQRTDSDGEIIDSEYESEKDEQQSAS